jgi:hypothetical protein
MTFGTRDIHAWNPDGVGRIKFTWVETDGWPQAHVRDFTL